MTKQQLEFEIKKATERKEWWWIRERAAAWNDDGKGGHINAMKMITKYEGRIEVLQELLSKYYQ